MQNEDGEPGRNRISGTLQLMARNILSSMGRHWRVLNQFVTWSDLCFKISVPVRASMY